MSDVWQSDDYFALFDIAPAFDLDSARLAGRYRQLQQAVHPDRFADQGEQAQRIAVQRAALVNDAYQTLKSPLRRAEYLLARQGVELAGEQHTLKDTAFLMQQMEWREALEEAEQPEQLDDVRADVQRTRKQLLSKFSQAFQGEPVADPQQYADDVRKLRFIDKMISELDKREDALSSY